MKQLAIGLLLLTAGWAVPALAAGPADASRGDTRDEDAERYSLSLGYDQGSGHYGAAASASYSRVPIAFAVGGRSWGFDLTVPYLTVTAPAGSVPVDGVIVPGIVRGTSTQKASGRGEVVAGVSYEFPRGDEADPVYRAAGHVKFGGTADATRGLGSGRNDYTGQAERVRTIGPVTYALGAGYTWRGRTDVVALRNSPFASIDGSYKLAPPLAVGLGLYAERPLAYGLGSRREATAYLNAGFGAASTARLYVTKGLSSASSEIAAGMAVSLSF
jgi:hypothetical protein